MLARMMEQRALDLALVLFLPWRLASLYLSVCPLIVSVPFVSITFIPLSIYTP